MSLLYLPMKYVNIAHILIIGASLIYISYYQSKTPFWIYYLLIVLSLGIVLFVPIPNLELTNFRNVLYIAHYILFDGKNFKANIPLEAVYKFNSYRFTYNGRIISKDNSSSISSFGFKAVPIGTD